MHSQNHRNKGGTMRLPMLPPSILFSILISTSPARCAIDLDFSAYPTSTHTCLTNAASIAKCTGNTVVEMNQCLCGNTGNFVLNSATCIGNQGDSVMTNVWDLLQESCSNTKTPLEVSEAQFFATQSEKTVTSTITTTGSSAGVFMTYTTTITSAQSSATATATSTSTTTSTSDNDQIVASAKIGAITASIAGTLFIICVVCLIVLLRKRKQDKALLRRAQEAARYGDRDRGPDKPLLNPGDVTPGLTALGGSGREGMLGANVAPPTPSYAGPISPQVWRSWSQATGQGMPTSPSELHSDQRAGEPYEDRPQGHQTHWPSPLTQGFGTMGSWCPSPLSAVPSSNVLGMYNGGTSTIGAPSTHSSPLSRQITGSTTAATLRSSWAHNRPQPEELYELPGDEVRSPVEADSRPISRIPARSSMGISPELPEYSAGGWNDPITDKPPTWI